ncbi:MAG: DUF2336 domain-containing protein [Bauldia sp.]
MLEDLTLLASRRSDPNRAELLFRLGDLYAESEADLADAEADLFADIFARVIASVSRAYRLKVSQHFAHTSNLPHNAAVQLASDSDAEVAGPMLEHSPLLTDDDLAGIAVAASQEHLLAIGGRSTLAIHVTSILVDRGDKRVIHRVSGNQGAALSTETFDRLIVKARKDRDLQLLLAERDDLTVTVVQRLVDLAADTIEAELEREGFESTPELPRNIRETMRRVLGAELSYRRVETQILSRTAAAIKSGRSTLGEAVDDLLRNGRLLDVATLFALVGRIDRGVVFTVVAKGRPAQLMLLCKGLDLAWPTVNRLFNARAKIGLMPAPRYGLEPKYAEIDAQAARRTMRFLRLRRWIDKQRQTAAA